jgi:hypothetical protein
MNRRQPNVSARLHSYSVYQPPALSNVILDLLIREVQTMEPTFLTLLCAPDFRQKYELGLSNLLPLLLVGPSITTVHTHVAHTVGGISV